MIAFKLIHKEQQTVHNLMQELVLLIVMTLHRFKELFMPEEEVWYQHVGWKLLQERWNSKFCPKSYWSRALHDGKKNDETFQKVCPAAFLSSGDAFHVHRKNSSIVRTDQQSLKCVLDLKDSTWQRSRWQLLYLHFWFWGSKPPNVKTGDRRCAVSVAHRSSRQLRHWPQHIDLYGYHYTRYGWRKWRRRRGATNSLEIQIHSTWSCSLLLACWKEKCSQHLVFEIEIITLPRQARLDEAVQKFVFPSLRKLVLNYKRNQKIDGHSGASQMYHTLRRLHYWLHMANDICN